MVSALRHSGTGAACAACGATFDWSVWRHRCNGCANDVCSRCLLRGAAPAGGTRDGGTPACAQCKASPRPQAATRHAPLPRPTPSPIRISSGSQVSTRGDAEAGGGGGRGVMHPMMMDAVPAHVRAQVDTDTAHADLISFFHCSPVDTTPSPPITGRDCAARTCENCKRTFLVGSTTPDESLMRGGDKFCSLDCRSSAFFSGAQVFVE
jgi:hypothetical protein